VAESVADLLRRLSFVRGSVESLYLNETRVHENFIGQLGAIESFTREAERGADVKGGIPFITVGGKLGSNAGATWNLTDPVTQVLVLRSALEKKELLRDPDHAAPGEYVRFAGRGYISRPGLFDDEQAKVLETLRPGLYEELEAERSKKESVSQITEGPNSYLWLLTIDDGTSMCAATLDNRWLRPAFRHWHEADPAWEVFGLFRQRHKMGIPLLAVMYVGIKWQQGS
jgi:hypothetical protein